MNGLIDKYDERHIIGQGAFAVVKLALERETGRKVAIKTIDKARILLNTGTNTDESKAKKEKSAMMFRREVEILRSIDHVRAF